MGIFETAEQFIARSHECTDLTALSGLLDEVTRELGFSHFALVNHVDVRGEKQNVFNIHSYPEDWAQQFTLHRRITTDPVVLATYTTNIGFLWEAVPDMITLTSAHKAALEAARAQGIGQGYTVPSHIPGEANGSCNFAQPVGREVPMNSLPAAQLVGSFAFQAARKLLHSIARELPSDPVKLTPRQLDCIVLVARGKTDWEIGVILGLNEETVTDYLNEARKRYGVSRRVQLVLRTVHDGYLTLADTFG